MVLPPAVANYQEEVPNSSVIVFLNTVTDKSRAEASMEHNNLTRAGQRHLVDCEFITLGFPCKINLFKFDHVRVETFPLNIESSLTKL
jgi:hypothetical protein